MSPLVVIVGETASGKSSLAIELAERFNGEIICADSWTVRQEVNIGTAKPSQAERARVSHHLLDIVGPCEDFTAAVFKRLALDAIEDITQQGKLPIMVGGTGLYVDGVIYDFGFLPEGDRGARQELNKLTNDELLKRIQVAQISLGDVDVRNKRRLIRLLETNGKVPSRGQLRPRTLLLGLRPERDELNERIEKRVDAMLAAGLEREVQHLQSIYGWECEALKGIGYREWKDYFAGTQTLQQTRGCIIKSTKDLAKRQRTWLNRNNSIHWLYNRDSFTESVDLITTLLNN